MSRSEPAVEKTTSNDALASATPPTVEAGRYERACIETMTTERAADRLYRVVHDGSTYDVDLEGGACTCADHQFRGDEHLCKHALRAALVDVYRHRKARSALAARVIAFANEHGCEASGCNGPFLAGDDGLLPCPACCDAVRSEGIDEFDVWQVTRR
jgi:hypothetical protein